jgi:hypothetical protein
LFHLLSGTRRIPRTNEKVETKPQSEQRNSRSKGNEMASSKDPLKPKMKLRLKLRLNYEFGLWGKADMDNWCFILRWDRTSTLYTCDGGRIVVGGGSNRFSGRGKSGGATNSLPLTKGIGRDEYGIVINKSLHRWAEQNGYFCWLFKGGEHDLDTDSNLERKPESNG